MYLSLFVFLKKNLMREGQLLFVIRRRRRRGEEEGAKNDVMESQSTGGKLRKNFRLGFYQKKKVHTKFLPSLSIFTTRKNNKARARGCSCVCVSV